MLRITHSPAAAAVTAAHPVASAGVGQQRHVLVLQRGPYASHVRVGFPVGEAGEAVEPVAANTSSRLRVGLAPRPPGSAGDLWHDWLDDHVVWHFSYAGKRLDPRGATLSCRRSRGRGLGPEAGTPVVVWPDSLNGWQRDGQRGVAPWPSGGRPRRPAVAGWASSPADAAGRQAP